MNTGQKTLIMVVTVAALSLAASSFGSNQQAGESDNGSPGMGHNYTQQDRGGAGQGQGPSAGMPPRIPPQEAITACEGKSAGDEVEFQTRHGNTIKGTCVQKDDMLFAVPDKGKRPPGGMNRQRGGSDG